VTRDVPSYAIVAGNPARIVKFRFDEKTMERLLRTRWFDYDIETVGQIDHSKKIEQQIEMFNCLKESGRAKPLPGKTNLYQVVIEMAVRRGGIAIPAEKP